MNRFLLLVLTGGLLSSCSYGSFYEANEGCEKWKKEGGTYTVETKSTKNYVPNDYYRFEYLRVCKDDSKTNQILGM